MSKTAQKSQQNPQAREAAESIKGLAPTETYFNIDQNENQKVTQSQLILDQLKYKNTLPDPSDSPLEIVNY